MLKLEYAIKLNIQTRQIIVPVPRPVGVAATIAGLIDCGLVRMVQLLKSCVLSMDSMIMNFYLQRILQWLRST